MQVGCLVIIQGAEEGKKYLLKDLTVFEGGRSQGHHIFLKDESVARSHFRIFRSGEDYSILDLGTSKGTLVNGKPIEKATLSAGDQIKIGDVELDFELVDDSTPGRAASSAPELTTQSDVGADTKVKDIEVEKEREREREKDRGKKPAGPETAPALLVVDGKDKGRTFLLAGKERFKIGRAIGSDLKLADGKISREHCLVETVRDHHIIIDLDSSNGTVVNGERVKKTVLKEGDYIRLGFTLIKYDRV